MDNVALTTETQNILLKSDDERLTYITKECWIDYPLASDILQKMEDLIRYEKGKLRVTSILLVGSSNNGKTSLLERFISLHKNYDLNLCSLTEQENFYTEYHATGMPVVYILAPTEVTESRLYSEILSTLNAEYRERDTVAAKKKLVEFYFKQLNVETLIIDEIHNILGGSALKRNSMMDTIKNLSNSLKIPIILSGTKDALRAISTNNQISSRFRPVYLTKWKMDKDFINLLATILSILPLKKQSNILNKNSAEIILEISEGYIGEIINLLKAAAIYAIRTGSERITIDEIKNCNFNSLYNVHKNTNLKNI